MQQVLFNNKYIENKSDVTLFKKINNNKSILTARSQFYIPSQQG